MDWWQPLSKWMRKGARRDARHCQHLDARHGACLDATPHALVTGGTGFIGSNIALRLVERGWRVSILARAGASHELLWKADRFGLSKAMFSIQRPWAMRWRHRCPLSCFWCGRSLEPGCRSHGTGECCWHAQRNAAALELRSTASFTSAHPRCWEFTRTRWWMRRSPSM